MSKPLIIVESPAKARTIAGFLGSDYVVTSSVGHIRDLPSKAADVPAKYKGESWARLAVNVDNDFEPLYIVSKEKRETVKELKRLLDDASELYLATDEDREGEAIAWHLTEVLKPKVPVKRMVFHEITPGAIQAALDNPREINGPLVDAQEARRVLDRLYGYEVSPVLWRKVKPKLSAGRVQSVATRIVVERERERIAFHTASYWDVEGQFSKDDTFGAKLVLVDQTRVASGKDFTSDGVLGNDDVLVLNETEASELVTVLGGSTMTVRSVEAKPYTRKPYAPFRTSTLQQEAGRKLRFSSARAMSAAQRLYENGFITYMRTDSTALSETAVAAARSQITEIYGADYVPDKPREYSKKVKGAQEAHEAIRPAGDSFRMPDVVAAQVNEDEARLYELIWMRTIASQMKDAKGESVQVRLGATASDGRDTEFSTSGRTITFPGFLRAYVEGSDDPDAELDDQERPLPNLAEGDQVDTVSLEAKGHETKPPARYTEASLVRRLEELGVGRPSTYASIMSTIQNRGYVWKKGSALVPSFTAFATVGLLEEHFSHLVDYAFTAKMETDLDQISTGDEDPKPWLHKFYFGETGLKALTADERLEGIDPRAINTFAVGTDDHGREIVARVGQYGPYLQRDEDRASIPEDLPPDELSIEVATELLDAPSGDKILGTDPDSGLTVLARAGRYGPYIQLGEIEEDTKKKKKEKPKTASLFKSMSLDDVTLDQALQLLTIPRVVGIDPEDDGEIMALNGRYGPYVKKGTDSRTIESEEQLLTITLEEAVEIFKQPKRRRGQAAAAPLKELGDDPVSGKPVVLKNGRFGPYVTDGTTNGSLRKGDDPETITNERAYELLQMRRDRG